MNNKMKRILAVDSGEKRIGLAISDLTGTISNPLIVIKHIQREKDAEAIVAIAIENLVTKIIVGQAFYEDGTPNPSGRKSARLAKVIQSFTDIPVILWDEYESTKIAQEARREMRVNKKKHHNHMDDLAATVILQSYLDSTVSESNSDNNKSESDEKIKEN
jgi:putative Holliday junction resolvase